MYMYYCTVYMYNAASINAHTARKQVPPFRDDAGECDHSSIDHYRVLMVPAHIG